jgi:outer membrane biosynthesis protein TonB
VARPSKPVLSAEQKSLGDGWNHVVKGGRAVKATHPAPPAHPTPVVAKAATQPTKTTSKKVVKPAKATPKAPEPSKKVPEPKRQATKPTQAKVAKPTQPEPSPLEEISDLLDTLTTEQSLQLSRKVLAAFHSLPTGANRWKAVLRVIILFVAEYGSTP